MLPQVVGVADLEAGLFEAVHHHAEREQFPVRKDKAVDERRARLHDALVAAGWRGDRVIEQPPTRSKQPEQRGAVAAELPGTDMF